MMKNQLLKLCLLATLATSPFTLAANPQVTVETNLGNFVITLYPEKAPRTVENFLAYVDDGFYVGTIFHRVIPGFMAQTGGFTDDMKEKKTREPIDIETRNGLHNERGMVAMARTNDPNSATSQFYVNLSMNLNLDWSPRSAGYTVFGKVTEGMHVINEIGLQPTGTSGRYNDVPVEPIIILKAYRAPVAND